MGKIYNKFSKVELTSESSVEQKFIYPFLIEFLGYQINEVIPQKGYESVNIPFNRSIEIPSKYLEFKLYKYFFEMFNTISRIIFLPKNF